MKHRSKNNFYMYKVVLGVVDKFSYCHVLTINVRLHQDRNGGAWCPKQQVMRGVKEWIEIDLKTMHVISTIQTQVRFIILKVNYLQRI